MAKPFPLYDELVKEASKDTTAVIDPSRICRTLSFISKEHAEMIFILIHHHHIVENGVSFKTVPYNGTVGAMNNRGSSADGELKCVSFCFTSLPGKLKLIIAKYLEMAAASK